MPCCAIEAPGWRGIDRYAATGKSGKSLARQHRRWVRVSSDRHSQSWFGEKEFQFHWPKRKKKNAADFLFSPGGGGGNGGFRGFGRGGGGGEGGGDGGGKDPRKVFRYLCCAALGTVLVVAAVHSDDSNGAALALTYQAGAAGVSDDVIWKIKDGRWTRYIVDEDSKQLVVDVTKMSEDEAMAYEREKQQQMIERADKGTAAISGATERDLSAVRWCLDALKTTMLPVGYPKTVSDDYTEYTLWRMGQIIASQISGVLTTQALLYAVGLGKGAIPTAAAINWVLKDGIGYLSKIVLSKYGRHFDVHPKGWRLVSDLIEDAACGLELLTPTLPHLFVPLTAVAGAGKSAAGLIQAATRSCFYAGFATQNNFAEVIAKGEAQGMVSKSLGIALGIAVSSRVGSSGPLLVLAFATVTAVHVLCNLRSYQAVQLHTLNPYRTGLIMAEFLATQTIPSVRDVNSVEPIFTFTDLFSSSKAPLSISCESKRAAADMENNLKLGVSLGEAVDSTEAARALFELYAGEEYLLTHDASSRGGFKVVLKQSASPHDMLRAVVQASYLRNLLLAQHGSVRSSKEELLRRSYRAMRENFDQLKERFRSAGWSTSGLLARPGSNRLVSA